MSRIGKLPITLPKGVEVKIDGQKVSVKGPKGQLERTFAPEIELKLEDGTITVSRPNDEPHVRALHGTTRALLNNMIVGCGEGFTRVLEYNGVGYRAELQGKDLVLNVGYSHPVNYPAPDGIEFDVDARARTIKIMGRDRQQVGQVAAEIRKVRPPERYHGTGIRYQGEEVKLKAGKSGRTGK
ncbi:MAG TPA: 50S ribosomal protein L6 [Anaerolineaceae bacterium]|jgi:large subunit ribosomal protein L6|nr:50S ribosomal protein L6 [Anaerolineaceae bacterium]HNZ14668.1 50S ribosomal protein L6 [Anaerolineaceae bacterium]HOH91868.1 50S ribosomal protein L6 [Anaerolineaceae bacterium]HQL91927.1 50S ribosomal protein L6 [Anaerolineaceae bacterium]HQN68394.1 50S ribosomal protein L6 [Anaerolineaceae bacterium]